MLYYRIAYDDGHEWRFIPAAYSDITTVYRLIQGNLVGAGVRVFGATSFEKLDEQLARFNQGKDAVCVKDSDLMNGTPFNKEDIELKERLIEEEEQPFDKEGHRRLLFYR